MRQLAPDESEHDTRRRLDNRTDYRDFPFRRSPRAGNGLAFSPDGRQSPPAPATTARCGSGTPPPASPPPP
jgi:hypothetical protein